MPDERTRTEQQNASMLPPDAPIPEMEARGPYERFINWAADLPWWAIILGVVAVIVLYSMLTSAAYRRVLRYLTDSPETSTENLYKAVLVVGERVEIVGEYAGETGDTVVTVINQLLKNEANPTLVSKAGFLVNETPARLTLQTDSGLILLPKDNIVEEEREEIDGKVLVRVTYTQSRTVIGTITAINDKTMRIRTVDEEKETFPTSRVLSREVVETTPCDHEAEPDCQDTQIVTIQRRGETFTGTLTTLSNTNLSIALDDGGSRELKMRDVEYFTVAALTRAFSPDAVERTVTDGDTVRIGYEESDVAEDFLASLSEKDRVRVPLVYSEGEAEVELVRYDDVDALLADTANGELDGMLYIAPGPQHPQVDAWVESHPDANLAELATQVCQSGCRITVKLVDDEITGRVAAEDKDTITVVTTEPEYAEVAQADILERRKMEPGTCALNNLRGCNAGIFLTLRVTFQAYGLALIIGLIVGIMRVQTNPMTFRSKLMQTFFTSASTLYVEVVRGIPLLVILLYAGFVVSPYLRDHPINMPDVLVVVMNAILAVLNAPLKLWNSLGIAYIGDLGTFPDPIRVNLNDEQEAVLGLAFGYGAFVAEIFRAGIQSISRGQMEAARSLGMSYPQAMRYVVLPQAIRTVLPPLGNDFIAMLKDSALISVLALPDLLQLGRLYISRTFRAFEGYNSVAVLYLLMTLFLSMLVRIIERRSRLPG